MAKSALVMSYHAKLLVVLAVFLTLSLGMTNRRINDRRPRKNLTHRPIVTKKPPLILDELYDLVLKNFKDSNQLELLLPEKNKRHKKLIFQFYLNGTDTLKLAAFVGKKRRRKFDSTFQILSVWAPRNFHQNLAGKKVFLNDQEISTEKENHHKNIKTLRSWINKPDKKYIIFRPRLDDKNHIFFELIPVDSIKIVDVTTKANDAIVTNPSPPKDAHY
jgi:hypothetical protein